MASQNSSNRYTITLDDEPMVARIIEKATGMKSVAYESASKLVEECANHHPIAAFIDIHLGDRDCGLDIIPALRKQWPYCPIIVVTADPTDEAVCHALESGADDFLQKPIRPKELLARLQTRLVEHSRKEEQHTLRMGDVRLDPSSHLLTGPLGKCYLSPTETRLLIGLWDAKGTVVSKEKIKRLGWQEISVSDNAVDRRLFELRRALEEVGGNTEITAVYGRGVRLGKRI